MLLVPYPIFYHKFDNACIFSAKYTGVFFAKITRYTLFFISNTFISNARLKLAKNQTKAKQHSEAELSLFEIIGFLHPRYHPKIIGYILKKCKKNKCV